MAPARRTFSAVLSDRLAERKLYGSTGSWVLNLCNRALLRTGALPVPGKKRAVRVRLPQLARPVLVRLATSDFFVMEEMFFQDEYGPAIARVPKDAGLVVDLGANIGLSARLWLDRFASARVIAVEPDPDNAHMIERNAQHAPRPERLTVLQCCVGGQARSVTLTRQRGQEWGFRISDGQRGGGDRGDLVVEAITLPEVLRRAGVSDEQPIDLLKCDIEGAERELFAPESARRWLGRVKSMIVELHEPYGLELFLKDVAGAGGGFGEPQILKQSGPVTVLFMTR